MNTNHTDLKRENSGERFVDRAASSMTVTATAVSSAGDGTRSFSAADCKDCVSSWRVARISLSSACHCAQPSADMRGWLIPDAAAALLASAAEGDAVPTVASDALLLALALLCALQLLAVLLLLALCRRATRAKVTSVPSRRVWRMASSCDSGRVTCDAVASGSVCVADNAAVAALEAAASADG